MAKFLMQFLRALPFPEDVLPDVIDAYAPRYANALAFNKHLGPSSTLLAERLVKTQDWQNLSNLVHMENREVLDTLLGSCVTDDSVITAIISTWWLSATDQLRLIGRNLSVDSACQVMADLGFNEDSREKARRFLPGYYDNYHYRGLGPAKVSFTHPRSKSKPKPPAPVFPEQLRTAPPRELPLTELVSELGCLISGLHRLADPLVKSIGTGSTPESLRAWMLFLGLIEDDPLVPLQTVISTARSLARAEC